MPWTEHLPLPEKREDILKDCQKLLEAEVAKKTGITGFAIKTAYKVFTAIKPGIVHEAFELLLDDFLKELEPFHAEFLAKGQGTFGASLKPQPRKVAEALLNVTDRQAQKVKSGTIRALYQKLRPSALRNVEESIPGLSQLVDKYYRS